MGLGATTCRQFNDDVRSNSNIRLNYLAWAHGFMSGILLGRPPGVDVGLNLDHPTFGLLKQLQFLEQYCKQNASQNFADGVEALYKRLRQEGKPGHQIGQSSVQTGIGPSVRAPSSR